MGKGTVYFPAAILKDFVTDVFMNLSVPKADAMVCADVIIASDLRGIESHGINRLKYYSDRILSGQQQVKTNFEIVRDTSTTAVVDGHHGMGMVIAKRAMQMAIDKARQHGMGSVAVRNSTHFGIAGFYPLMAVEQGMVGFTVTNTRPSVSPTFGVQPILGTNPIAFGAPTDELFPFLFDAATPIIQRGKVEVYARKKKPVPDGWVINHKNQYMHDPQRILASLNRNNASLVPLGGSDESMGGHKGYGLGTMVEILSASLQQGSFLQGLLGISEAGNLQPFCIGHFFMTINVECFTALDDFRTTTGKILRALRSSRKAPGIKRIYTAGEKEHEMWLKRSKEGIPVNSELLLELKTIQSELNLPIRI